jgi:hypothetical protein
MFIGRRGFTMRSGVDTLVLLVLRISPRADCGSCGSGLHCPQSFRKNYRKSLDYFYRTCLVDAAVLVATERDCCVWVVATELGEC